MDIKRASIWTLLLLACLPILYPTSISTLDIYQHRMLSIVLLAVILWVSEIVPVYATGLLIICLELIFLSNKGFIFLLEGPAPLDYKQVLANFASPIVILFLGGFSLAAAANKYKIDKSMAKFLLSPFGKKPASIMFGLMLITALFSMFMSNTATTAMMLAILAPVLTNLPPNEPARKGFLLAIPLAANIGGMGTPIGTPPNAVAMKYLTGANSVSFANWMAFGIPLVVILLAFAWWWLLCIFKPNIKLLDLQIKTSRQAPHINRIFYITFAGTVLLWLTGSLHGLNSYVVAMIPLTVFFITGLLDKADIKTFNWEVLWLIAGGIALGEGMTDSGLSKALMDMIPFANMSMTVIMIVFTLLAYLMANFVSNTATANLILPLVVTIVMGFGATDSPKSAIIQIALTCSLGMALPISTPPNALAYSTGQISSNDLLRTGGIMSLLGLVLVYLAVIIF